MGHWREPHSLARLGVSASFGTLCLVVLWAGIDTGPWTLDWNFIESSWSGCFNGVRAAFPLAALAAWVVHVLLRKRSTLRRLTIPEALWLYYGLICFVSTILVSPWFDHAYWGFAYLGVFAATEAFMHESDFPVDRAATLNRLNWILASVILAILLWVSRGKLLVHTSAGATGYGLIERMPTVAGMAMSRETGMARFAAVPALLSLVSLWTTHGRTRLISVTVFAAMVYLIWLLQSRGALFSFAFAASFSMMIIGGRARHFGLALAAISAFVYMAGMVPDQTIHLIFLHATRGTQGQQLLSGSGRTTWIYPRLWGLIKQSPVIGYGWRADRRVAFMDAQNGVLYALLCGGFVGGFGFIAGLAAAWATMLRLLWRINLLPPDERVTFIQTAAIIVFFTMRTIPENCAALYSVDLMVQLPAFVYLGELDRALKRVQKVQRTRRRGLAGDGYTPAYHIAQIRY
jgi:hypothetical protein